MGTRSSSLLDQRYFMADPPYSWADEAAARALAMHLIEVGVWRAFEPVARTNFYPCGA